MVNRPKIIISLNSKKEFSELGTQLKNFQGFDVVFLDTEEEILKRIRQESFDFLIIDLEMKDTDGVVLCREVKKISNGITPFVLIASERNEDYIQAIAFDSGADGFLLKPLKARVIAARLNAMLKRKTQVQEPKSTARKDLSIDTERHMVIINSREIFLPKKEFNLLNLLFSNPQKIYSKSEIARHIWGDVAVGAKERRTIDVHISNLRNKIGENYIRTVSGVGYIFNS